MSVLAIWVERVEGSVEAVEAEWPSQSQPSVVYRKGSRLSKRVWSSWSVSVLAIWVERVRGLVERMKGSIEAIEAEGAKSKPAIYI